jgi:hypothetical protein
LVPSTRNFFRATFRRPRRESYAQLFLNGGARQFMPGSSAPLLNLLEFQSMTRLRGAAHV